MSPSDRRTQMHAILADAVEAGRRLSPASPRPALRRLGTPAQRQRLLATGGGVLGAVLTAFLAMRFVGGPDPAVQAPYVPPPQIAVSTPDPAGVAGQLPRIDIATLPPAPLLHPRVVVPAVVPNSLGPSHSSPSVHAVAPPPPAVPPAVPPAQAVVAAPLLPAPPPVTATTTASPAPATASPGPTSLAPPSPAPPSAAPH